MIKVGFAVHIVNNRKVKKLDPEFHGRKGFRVESTGSEFKTLKATKDYISKLVGGV